MQNEILVNVEMQEKRAAIVKDGVLDEYYIERPTDKTIVGNIYKGKIETIVPSIGAAFVDIGLDKKGFLYLSDIVEPIEPIIPIEAKKKEFKKGEEVLVQVVKEPIGNKGPRLTTHIGIPGRFVVLMPFDHHLGISKKVTDYNERDRLRQILKKIVPNLHMGLIVRTAGVGKSEPDFKREIRYLAAL